MLHRELRVTLPRIMTVSAVPPKIRRGLGVAWIVMVVLGLIVAAGNALLR
jgi:hypothetical protein